MTRLTNMCGIATTSLLFEVTVRVSLVLLIALAVIWCLWHRSAAARYWVLSVEIATASRLGLTRPGRLLQSDHPTLLSTWGFVWPRVMLPAGAQAWEDDRRRVVLAHELAHVRRGDWATQLCADVLRGGRRAGPASDIDGPGHTPGTAVTHCRRAAVVLSADPDPRRTG